MPALSWAQNPAVWFDVLGNQLEPAIDAVQLNVANVEPRGQIKLMDMRVNLAAERTMSSGEKYSSYTSKIAIDCASGSVFHVRQTRYVDKGWQGSATAESFVESKPMAFGGLTPDPKPVVLRAACVARP